MGGAGCSAYTPKVFIRRAIALFLVLSGCAAPDDSGMCATEDVTYHIEVRLGPRTLARLEALPPSEHKVTPEVASDGALEPSDGPDQASVESAAEAREPEADGPSSARSALPTVARLVVSVYEDASYVSCEGDLIGSRVPGYTLAVASRMVGPTLSLDVPLTRYRELGTPKTVVDVRLDSDGKGDCDEDEPSGTAVFDPSHPGELVIELDSEGCPTRL